MAARLNDLTKKAIDESHRNAADLRLNCDKHFHECIVNTINTGLDQYAEKGKYKANISLHQMDFPDKCVNIAEKVMTNYINENPKIKNVRLTPKTFYDFAGTRFYNSGLQNEVTFDWSKHSE